MRFRAAGSPWLLAVVVAACGEVSPAIQDAPDSQGPALDVPRLSDATILVPGDADWAPDAASADTGELPAGPDAGPDTGATWEDGGKDPGGPPELFETDPASPDPGSPEDLGARDAPVTEDLPEAPPCGPEQRPCDPTQVCVWDSDGASRCVAMAECSDRGAIDLQQLIRWFLQGGQPSMSFKVRGQPWAGQPTCGGPSCDGLCCRSCWSFLFLGDEGIALPLMGQGVSISCQGNECDWMDHCAPMTPGQWYWIWGSAERLGPDFRLLVDGFCPADASPAKD